MHGNAGGSSLGCSKRKTNAGAGGALPLAEHSGVWRDSEGFLNPFYWCLSNKLCNLIKSLGGDEGVLDVAHGAL